MTSRTLVFEELSPATTIYNPPTDAAFSVKDAPSTVLICGFMGATTSNLSRYSEKYNALYPAARIIVVTSTLTDTLGFTARQFSKKLNQRTEIPAQALLASMKDGGDMLLVHAFSNGGAMTLAAVSKSYHRIAGTALPARMVVLDSLPGGDHLRNEFSRWVKAIGVGLPANPAVKWPAKFLIVLVVIALLGLPSLFGYENAITKARLDLNNEDLISLQAKRLYIYSEADALVGANEVREHAAESAAKGCYVKTVNFGDSGHIRHAIVYKGKSTVSLPGSVATMRARKVFISTLPTPRIIPLRFVWKKFLVDDEFRSILGSCCQQLEGFCCLICVRNTSLKHNSICLSEVKQPIARVRTALDVHIALP